MLTKPQLLHRSLSGALIDIEHQILSVNRQAQEMKTEPSRIQDMQGNFLLTPLLVAKAQILHSLTLLEIGEIDSTN